jgi:hypothetical protein
MFIEHESWIQQSFDVDTEEKDTGSQKLTKLKIITRANRYNIPFYMIKKGTASLL